jgi:hypothetical protein
VALAEALLKYTFAAWRRRWRGAQLWRVRRGDGRRHADSTFPDATAATATEPAEFLNAKEPGGPYQTRMECDRDDLSLLSCSRAAECGCETVVALAMKDAELRIGGSIAAVIAALARAGADPGFLGTDDFLELARFPMFLDLVLNIEQEAL